LNITTLSIGLFIGVLISHIYFGQDPNKSDESAIHVQQISSDSDYGTLPDLQAVVPECEDITYDITDIKRIYTIRFEKAFGEGFMTVGRSINNILRQNKNMVVIDSRYKFDQYGKMNGVYIVFADKKPCREKNARAVQGDILQDIGHKEQSEN